MQNSFLQNPLSTQPLSLYLDPTYPIYPFLEEDGLFVGFAIAEPSKKRNFVLFSRKNLIHIWYTTHDDPIHTFGTILKDQTLVTMGEMGVYFWNRQFSHPRNRFSTAFTPFHCMELHNGELAVSCSLNDAYLGEQFRLLLLTRNEESETLKPFWKKVSYYGQFDFPSDVGGVPPVLLAKLRADDKHPNGNLLVQIGSCEQRNLRYFLVWHEARTNSGFGGSHWMEIDYKKELVGAAKTWKNLTQSFLQRACLLAVHADHLLFHDPSATDVLVFLPNPTPLCYDRHHRVSHHVLMGFTNFENDRSLVLFNLASGSLVCLPALHYHQTLPSSVPTQLTLLSSQGDICSFRLFPKCVFSSPSSSLLFFFLTLFTRNATLTSLCSAVVAQSYREEDLKLCLPEELHLPCSLIQNLQSLVI